MINYLDEIPENSIASFDHNLRVRQSPTGSAGDFLWDV
jgi:hypothetical protein